MGHGRPKCCHIILAAGAGASLMGLCALKAFARWMQRPKKAKITYFDIKGRAEPVRICIHAAGIELEDERLSLKDWGKMKAENPPAFGQLPVVEVNNCVVPESGAQVRYFAKLAHLYPRCPFQAVFCDVAIGLADDLMIAVGPSIRESDAKKKAEMRKALTESTIPNWLRNAENYIQERGGKWVTGNNMSVGDICLALRVEFLSCGLMDGIPANMADGYPIVKDHMTRTLSSPIVTRYNDSRIKI